MRSIHIVDVIRDLWMNPHDGTWTGWYQMSLFGPVYGWNKEEAVGAWVYYTGELAEEGWQ